MKIEYIYQSSENNRPDTDITIRQIERENTIGCLVTSIIMLGLLFVFLALLPLFLTILGYIILILAGITIYKVYLERHVLNFIQKHNLRR